MADPAPPAEEDGSALVAHWLRTAQLGHAVDNFKMAGIISPRSFSELELAYYGPLGVTEPEDRKKLFFLVQKVKAALEEGAAHYGAEVGGNGGADGGGDTGASGVCEKNDEDDYADEEFQSPSLSKDEDGPRGIGAGTRGTTDGLAVATASHNDDMMSLVETNPHHEPISPVTMASPIASVDGRPHHAKAILSPTREEAVPLGEDSAGKLTPRDRNRKELERRARLRREERAAQKKERELDEDDVGKKKTLAHARKGRRQSFLPSVGGSATSRRSSLASFRPTAGEKKLVEDNDDSDDELDSILSPPKSVTSGRSKVDARSRRSSLHHRATAKKTNARAKHRRQSGIPSLGGSGHGASGAGPSLFEKDEESSDSETSDLSASVSSHRSTGYSSAGSSVTTARTARSGLGRARTNENENRGNVDRMRRRLSATHKPKTALGGASVASTSARSTASGAGKKRLSTIPSSSIAPLSPLAGVPSAQLDERITGASARSVGPRNPVRRRSSLGVPGTRGGTALGRPGTAESGRSLSSRPSSRSSLGGSVSSARRARPLREKPGASSGSSVSSEKCRLQSPVRRDGDRAARARSRSPAPPPSSRGSSRSARSVSPKRSPKAAARPRSPVRSRPMSPVRSPTRSTSSRPRSPVRSPVRPRPLSPARSPRGSPKGSPKGSPRRAKSPVFVHGLPEDTSHATQIATLRQAFDLEHTQQAESRDAAGNEEEEEYEMRIRVIVRKRPMSGKEVAASDVDVIQPLEYGPYGRILVHQPKTKLDLAKEVETAGFAFDNVFGEGSNNAEIYERSVRSLIPGVFHGRWASVFAYGQTGSGKTFTMLGSNATGMRAGNQAENAGDQNLGLYFLAARDVFDIASDPAHADVSIGVSMFEIYGGKLLDLLNARNPVKCLEDRKGKVNFPGLSEHPVNDAEELMEIIDAGALNRSTGTTSANADSSRSHAVMQLSLRKDVGRTKNKELGRLTFIDLAGSERGADTSKACRTTRLEGSEINQSLLALKEVIRALAVGSSMKRIPFRGSKLTQVLKESFVGKHSRTVMVTCVAPNMKNCDHTLNTLRYADRVKERDPQTGQLSSAVAASSMIKRDQSEDLRVKLPPRPLTAPATSFRIEREDLSDESEEDDEVPPPPPSNEELLLRSLDEVERNEEKSAYSEFDYDKIVDSDENDSLEEVLRSNDDQPAAPGREQPPPRPRTAKNDPEAQSLIATHKTIMSKLLQMLQHEMTLVNDTDANRDNIDEYMKELGNLSDQQLALISTLRESLETYNSTKSANGGAAEAPAIDSTVDYEDSFILGD